MITESEEYLTETQGCDFFKETLIDDDLPRQTITRRIKNISLQKQKNFFLFTSTVERIIQYLAKKNISKEIFGSNKIYVSILG